MLAHCIYTNSMQVMYVYSDQHNWTHMYYSEPYAVKQSSLTSHRLFSKQPCVLSIYYWIAINFYLFNFVDDSILPYLTMTLQKWNVNYDSSNLSI